MDQDQWLAECFEADRERLRKIAYRLLGSPSEADDAVQEAWLRLSRSDRSGIDNLGGWLTTVVARVCLDMLRARKSQEVAVEALSDQSAWSGEADLEQEHLTAELVSLALLVVLEKLKPAERVAFVLHDVFDVPFEEIAPIIDHTPISARQLASRARRRVRGEPAVPPAALSGKRQIMAAFLDAVRAGDMDTIMALLDPSVVLRADASVTPGGTAVEVRGSTTVAKGALTFAARTRFASPMLVNGGPGIVVAPHGQVRSVLLMDIAEERIRTIEVFGDPARLAQMDFALIGDRN